MQNVYIAGKYTSKERLRDIAKRVNKLSHYQTSSNWLFEPDDSPFETTTTEERKYISGECLNDIMDSGVLIVDTLDETYTGGREVEVGVWLGMKLLGTAVGALIGNPYPHTPLILVGPERNVFHCQADYKFDNWDECLEFLGNKVL